MIFNYKRITKMNTQEISQAFKVVNKDAVSRQAIKLRYFNFTETINGFSNLEPNWDSYQADKISKKAIETAIETLKYMRDNDILSNKMTVNVFPMRDGGIQFEFDGETICAELEINQYGKLTFILYDEEGNLVESKEILELSELSTRL